MSASDAVSGSLPRADMPADWQRGYADQAAWLAGKTEAEAEQALRARLATLKGDYNAGGTEATRNYLADLAAACTDEEMFGPLA